MLCLDDCLDFCELDAVELEALSQHEHVPLIVAAELGATLLKSEAGAACLQQVLLEQAQHSLEVGHPEEAVQFIHAFETFQAHHPAVA